MNKKWSSNADGGKLNEFMKKRATDGERLKNKVTKYNIAKHQCLIELKIVTIHDFNNF